MAKPPSRNRLLAVARDVREGTLHGGLPYLAVGAGPVSILGTSTGGSIAQQFAIDHPRLVRRLVLTATACRLSPHGQEVQRRFAELTRQGRSRRAWAAIGPALAATAAGGRDRLYSPELFRETAERIPDARLRLYPDKGHAGVLTHRPAIGEIVAFLTAGDQPET
jgi:pimeloyl-ACP methyl ester carboxylesterase